MEARISHIFRKLLTAVMLSGIIFGAMPVSGADQAITELDVQDIEYVEASQADLIFLPLFYERLEDRPALQKMADAVNNMGKHRVKYHEVDAWQAFFDTDFTLRLKNGSTIDISFTPEGPNLSLPGQEPCGVDPEFSKYANLLELFRLPQTYDSWPSQAVLGKMYPLKGETTREIVIGQKEIDFFIRPLRTEFEGNRYVAVNGRAFPTKDALYIGSIPIKLGRYDTKMGIPPFGEALNGEMRPITPGTWSLYPIDGENGVGEIVVTPNPFPLLTLNGRMVPTDVPPRMEQGRLLVPLRALASALGAKIEWDGQSNRVLINTARSELPVRFSGTPVELWINGSKTNPEVPPRLYQNRVFVPARFVGEVLGAQVEWNQGLNTVNFVFNTKEE